MDCECKFNKKTDLGETCQNGFVVLEDLLAHGYVPATLNVAPSEFNDIDDPKAVYGKPADKFEAMTMAKTLEARAKAAEAAAASRIE